MKEEIAGKLIRQGVFEGHLWMGTVMETETGWLGSVHEVPLGEAVPRFVDFSAQVFNKFEDAERFVVDDWERRFGEK